MKFDIEKGSIKVTGTIVEFGKVNQVGDVYAPGCFKNLEKMVGKEVVDENTGEVVGKITNVVQHDGHLEYTMETNT